MVQFDALIIFPLTFNLILSLCLYYGYQINSIILWYVLSMGTIFSIFGGVYYWFYKITEVRYSEFLSKLHCWSFFIGVNLTFFPTHFFGIAGMRLGIPDYPDAFHFFNKIVTFFFKKKVFHNSLSKSMGTRFLFSKVGSVYFPVIWYETLITRSIPKVLGITAGFQSIVFGRYYSFLIMFLFIFFVAYLSVLITNIFETDKRLYCKLNDFILQNEVRLHNFSYWEKFKKLYLYVD